jgi:hypothetical protein
MVVYNCSVSYETGEGRRIAVQGWPGERCKTQDPI